MYSLCYDLHVLQLTIIETKVCFKACLKTCTLVEYCRDKNLFFIYFAVWKSSVTALCLLITNIYGLELIISSYCNYSGMNSCAWPSELKCHISRPDLLSQWNRGCLDGKYRGMLSGGTRVELKRKEFSRWGDIFHEG